ncbi:MAG: NOB1 family endonuclease [Candidatus Hadarchaeum sp.]|uniref:NOB1 family endonuclease n=1 Tax=Candidatus Hadarchaeum sp. TaxID=2883567 RepID=UPI003D0D7406
MLDTSAVIAGLAPGMLRADQVTVPEVLEEARDLCSKLKLETAVLAGKVRVVEPSKKSLERVREKVVHSGDTVSDTDVKLLALALDLAEKNAEIVTDDYAIQNLATLLNLPYRRFSMPGIKEVLRWEAVCPACGSKFPPTATICLICGSELKRQARR